MSDVPRKVTRNQLAAFLPDPRAIRAFEQMLQQVSDTTPANIETLTKLYEEAQTQAANADSRAQQALDALGRIAQSLELLVAQQQNNSIATDYIDVNNNAPVSYGVGRLWWNPTGTLNIGMGNGNITQQVGEEFFIYGKASSTITEGQLIMVTGAVGSSGVVTFAPTSTGLTDPNVIVGVATESIPLNGFGRVTTSGLVRGINTTGASVSETWADGDVLWYNPSIAGAMTKVKPTAPNMKTQVAIVTNAGPGGSGSLQIEVVHGTILGGTDSNVQLGALTDRQLLQYDSALGYWKNVAYTVAIDVAGVTHAATSKTTPVDNDELPLADSASSFSLKKLTWANLKTTLASWIGGNLISGSFTSLTSSNSITTTYTGGNAHFISASATTNGSVIRLSNTTGNSLFGTESNTAGTWASGSTANSTLVGSTVAKPVEIIYADVVCARFTNLGLAVLGTVTVAGGSTVLSSTSALTNYAGAGSATLTNAPAVGNPSKWIAINDAGTTRYIPTW